MNRSRDMYPNNGYSSKSRDSHKRDAVYPKEKSGMMGHHKHRDDYYAPKPAKRSMGDYRDPYPSKKMMSSEVRISSYDGERRGYDSYPRGQSGMRGRGGSYPMKRQMSSDSYRGRGGGGGDMYHKMRQRDGSYNSRGGGDGYDGGHFKPYRGGDGGPPGPSFSRGRGGGPYPSRGGRMDSGRMGRGGMRGGGMGMRGNRDQSFGPQRQQNMGRSMPYQGGRDQRRPFDRNAGGSFGMRRGRGGMMNRDSNRPFRAPERPFRDPSGDFRSKPGYGNMRMRSNLRPIPRGPSHSSRGDKYDDYDYKPMKQNMRSRGDPDMFPRKKHKFDYDSEDDISDRGHRKPMKRAKYDDYYDTLEPRRKKKTDDTSGRSSSRSQTREPSKSKNKEFDDDDEDDEDADDSFSKAHQKSKRRRSSGKQDDKEPIDANLEWESETENSGGVCKSKKKSVDSDNDQDQYSDEDADADDDDGQEGHRRPSRPKQDSSKKKRLRSPSQDEDDLRSSLRGSNSGSRPYVELRCPHCPNYKSITFREYRYHLDSRRHRQELEHLTYKNTVVLRKIRLQQRTELKEAEEIWAKEKPEEFERTVSRYCTICKLAFKCLPEDKSAEGIAQHNKSKLHKSQQRYLHPHCKICQMSFPSRMVYECHIASIRHLKMLTMMKENGDGELDDKGAGRSPRPRPDGDNASERSDDPDMQDFITMDAVGEEAELGTEKEEIVGNEEDLAAAEEAAKEGEEEDDASVGGAEEVDVEDEMEPGFDDGFDPDQEVVGKEYLVTFEGLFCELCHTAFRVDPQDTEEQIWRRTAFHCRSQAHIDHFNQLPPDHQPIDDLDEGAPHVEEHGEDFDPDELAGLDEDDVNYEEGDHDEDDETGRSDHREQKTACDDDDNNDGADVDEEKRVVTVPDEESRDGSISQGEDFDEEDKSPADDNAEVTSEKDSET